MAQHVSSSLKLQRTLALLTGAILAVIVILSLYWAQIIFIPIAAAIFLSFVLTPIVVWLQRRGLRPHLPQLPDGQPGWALLP